MKNLIFSALVLLVALSFTVSAQNKSGSDAASSKKTSVAAVDSKPFNTVCPVSGEALENNNNTAVYNGKTYALCCKKCLAKFQKNPEKYAANLSEDGKTFKRK